MSLRKDEGRCAVVSIDAFEDGDLAAITRFVEAIQEHERLGVPELRAGSEIGPSYVELLIRTAAERTGHILMAREESRAIGFVCAWVEMDDDPLLRDDARVYAYVSDIFVEPDWRRHGVAGRLLNAIEDRMYAQGCRRMRICSKAANRLAVGFYEQAGYRPHEIVFAKMINR